MSTIKLHNDCRCFSSDFMDLSNFLTKNTLWKTIDLFRIPAGGGGYIPNTEYFLRFFLIWEGKINRSVFL